MIKTLKMYLQEIGESNIEIALTALDPGRNNEEAVRDYLIRERTPIQIEVARDISKARLNYWLKQVYKYYFGKPYEIN